MPLKMSMCFVSNTSNPRTHLGARSTPRSVVTSVPPTLQSTTLQSTTLQSTTLQSTQPVTTQPTSSIITRTRARPNTSRFNMNDTFAARGRPCPRS